MPVQLNHTIVAARDAEASARWFAQMFGLDEPVNLWHFWQVTTANAVNLDFASTDDEIESIHYAFLVTDKEFDTIFGRIIEQGIDHWADPGRHHPGQINRNDGGRGVYFCSNDGHFLEILTVPYGGWN